MLGFQSETHDSATPRDGRFVPPAGPPSRKRDEPAGAGRGTVRSGNLRAMHILDELAARGLVADVTDRDALKKLLGDERVTLYAGYDPTFPSMHVGNLVPMIMQARLQRAGQKPLVIIGGATGMVGDPSGKSAERNLLGDDELAANVAGMRSQLSRFLDFGPGPTGAVLVNNADWTRGVGYLEFLRDVGKYLTVNYMMAKDSVRARLVVVADTGYTE